LEDEPQESLPGRYSFIFLACALVIFMLVVLQGWKFVMRRVAILEGKVNQLDRSMGYAEQQLAHHYEYDADLGTRLDAHDGRADVRDEAVDGLAVDWRFWKKIASRAFSFWNHMWRQYDMASWK